MRRGRPPAAIALLLAGVLAGCPPASLPGPEPPPPPAGGGETPAEPERDGPPEGLLAPWRLPPPVAAPVIEGRPPLEVALDLLGRGPQVLAFRRGDFVAPDPWRLDSVVAALEGDPFANLARLDATPDGLDPSTRLAWARGWLGLDVDPRGPPDLALARAVSPDALWEAAPEGSAWRGTGRGTMDALAALLGPFLGEVARARVLATEALAAVRAEDAERLRGQARTFPLDATPEDMRELLAILDGVDLDRMIRAGEVLARAAAALAEGLEALTVRAPLADVGAWPPLVLAHGGGRVIVGGPDGDVYRGPALAIVDLGGDDTYLDVEASALASVGVTVDVAGADLYRSEDAGGAGTGVLAAFVSVDLAGDDLYSGPGPGPAAALGGVGVLIDRAGNDTYVSERMGQGAAVVGVGLLIDEAGDDLYKASTFSQAFGGPHGVGVLVDGAGDDRYVAGLEVPDHREARGAFASFSQGYAMGFRDLASGGVGWLDDLGGDDAYLASYFSQGAAYWYGVGALVDREGDDRYVARRYSQGAGVHAAVGLLDDRRGDDHYVSWGVSQGCGHDLSVGLLRDGAGRDAYRGTWLVQGAGNDNSVGALLDAGGDDLYEAEGEQSQGWASLTREAIGIGLLLDGGGDDHFRGLAQPPAWTQGHVGVGVDGDGPIPTGRTP